MKDLVVLVADKNMEFALKGILNRPRSLNIRNISFEIRVHSNRDAGVRTTGINLLTIDRPLFSNALMLLDFEGCGANTLDPLQLEHQLDQQLMQTWGADGKSIVIAPEVDAWLWGSDVIMQRVLSWQGNGTIRAWLTDQGFALDANGKPLRPKEALEKLFSHRRLPRSSAYYQEITKKVSLNNCVDSSFIRLRQQLQSWF
jgi:hypothetical protein